MNLVKVGMTSLRFRVARDARLAAAAAAAAALALTELVELLLRLLVPLSSMSLFACWLKDANVASTLGGNDDDC